MMLPIIFPYHTVLGVNCSNEIIDLERAQLDGTNSKQKMACLAQHIAAEQYDVIAFQEINQSRFAPESLCEG